MRRLRENKKKSLAVVSAPVNQSQRFDTWLVRLSYITQIGLFFITIGSLYFTVLPLYQKAVLDEAIARKELELQKMDRAVNDYYSKIRSYIDKEFKNVGVLDCTILWKSSSKNQLNSNLKTPEKSVYQLSLEFDTHDCLLKTASRIDIIEHLNEIDRSSLIKAVEAASERINSARNEALDRFYNANKMTKEKADSMNIIGMRAQLLKALIEYRGADATERDWLLLAIATEQENAAVEFERKVMEEIRSIQF